jgi:deoxycytidine triphosphate deaminase
MSRRSSILTDVYLTDRQLRERLSEFAFASEDDRFPFDETKQIGPCSVDLRLSRVYWTPREGWLGVLRRPRVLDLERTRVAELAPRRGWDRHEIRAGDKITLKPGAMVLARVAEEFRVPSDCAGALEGRSSYARLGLSVHASAGFINPGWRGHMPLTLVNSSPVTLRLPVGTPICQLMVLPLSEVPERDYAARVDRKYLNDTGGPSYWWRDEMMQEIRDAISRVPLDARIFDELDELLVDADEDEGVFIRLEGFLADSGGSSFGNADELLEGFSRREERRARRLQAAAFFARWSWTAFFGLVTTVMFVQAPWWIRGVALGLLVISLMAAIRTFGKALPYHLTPDRLRPLQRARDTRRSLDRAASPDP